MSDLIKREKVFEHIKAVCLERDGGALVTSVDFLKMAIKGIPSAEKQGEWISLHNGKWKCSECGIEVLIYAKGNFCPNCGANMRGDNNETD